MKSYSQYKQDFYILENFFKQKINGFFVDIGAHDGITYSNSLLFEQLGWNGVCIEPIERIFKQLQINRKCTCVHGVISDSNNEFVQFCEIEGYSEMLSGILENYDERHKLRILNEEKLYNTKRKKINVKNYNFNKIITHSCIDLLDIDTEGNELNILKSIDFNKYKIGIILVENNFDTTDIQTFLTKHNFSFVTKIGADELYKNNQFNF
jgi:FkbM family methyltransferase